MKSEKKSLILCLILCVLALATMLLALSFGEKTIQADFVPPPFDSAACIGTPDIPEEVSWQELDAKVFRVSVCGEIRISGNMAMVWLTNPASNEIWMKMRILDMDGKILGETGLIKPGQYVKTVPLDKVPKVGTPVVLKVMTYEPETYYSAGSISLNTTIY